MELTDHFVLDTNAVIYLLNDRMASSLPNGVYSVSIITEMELLSFSGLSVAEEVKIHEFLNVINRLPISAAVRDQAIYLRRKYRLKLPDAIIGASALTEQATLVTNDQTFRFIEELKWSNLALK